MSAKFKGQRQWVQDVLKKFEDLEEHQPKPFNENPEWPEWVSNLQIIFLGVSHPGTKVKNVKKWKAKDLGRMLGQQYARELLIRGQVPLSAQVIIEGLRFAAGLERRFRQKRPDIDLEELHKQFEKDMRVSGAKFKRFMQEVLATACEQPYPEASAFFEAFGKAIVIKPDDLLTERTMGVNDKIRAIMLLMWQDIARLQSVGELHRNLVQALKPHGIEVELKFVEKLCQRIKLKFKNPGRPQSRKTQTNPTSA